MNRLSDNDRNFGPVTIGSWHKSFACYFDSGDDEDGSNRLMITAFGWAARLRLPCVIKPFGKYREHQRRYGASLSDMGNGYDFVQVFLGAQTQDSSTTQIWSCHLPWKQWGCVRHSIYAPDGALFYSQPERGDFFEFLKQKDQCPKTQFSFEDFDGELITATCVTEEREWRKGAGWFKWLRWLFQPKVRRDLDISFSAETGPGKRSWKGGTVGHGIDMLPGESQEDAFKRYCDTPHRQRGSEYRLRFLGRKENP